MATVFRRKVFYIPGYDPFPARRYRELYRTEGARQAAISGYDLGLVPGSRPACWRVAARIEGRLAETEVEVLAWSDIVRGSMRRGIVATYGALARTAWLYLSTGALFRLLRLGRGPVAAALYPVGLLLLQLVIAVVAGAGVAALAAPLAGPWPSAGAGLAAAACLLRLFRALDRHLYAHYLMHDFAFTAGVRGATPAALVAREEDFARRLAAALEGPLDEVLVVGHSSGAAIAVSVLARLVRDGTVARAGPEVALLTLGQSIPMISFLPGAHQLRADLRLLSEERAIAWVDVTAPGDGCAFALADPVAVSGVARPGKPWPLVLSAAFSHSLAPETFARLRRRYFRLHFQYLCAFDRPRDYDYFRITAGPRTLAARYAGRAPSKGRIEAAVSGYRSLAA